MKKQYKYSRKEWYKKYGGNLTPMETVRLFEVNIKYNQASQKEGNGCLSTDKSNRIISPKENECNACRNPLAGYEHHGCWADSTKLEPESANWPNSVNVPSLPHNPSVTVGDIPQDGNGDSFTTSSGTLKQPKVEKCECEICGYSMSKGLCHNRKNHPQLKDIEPINMATYQGKRETAIEIMVENKLNEIINLLNKQ